MKILIASTILSVGLGLVGGLGLSLAAAAEDTSSPKLTPRFPKSDKCTNSAPCQDVVGEVVKIEESYWIKTPNGNETHIRVLPATKMESRIKVGDSIAAQLTSKGEADAIMKFEEKPKAEELMKPKETLKDMR